MAHREGILGMREDWLRDACLLRTSGKESGRRIESFVLVDEREDSTRHAFNPAKFDLNTSLWATRGSTPNACDSFSRVVLDSCGAYILVADETVILRMMQEVLMCRVAWICGGKWELCATGLKHPGRRARHTHPLHAASLL